jgi:hypothetical protein
MSVMVLLKDNGLYFNCMLQLGRLCILSHPPTLEITLTCNHIHSEVQNMGCQSNSNQVVRIDTFHNSSCDFALQFVLAIFIFIF